MGSSATDGTLSPGEFSAGALAFAQRWQTVCHSHELDLPLWSWVSCSNSAFVPSNQVGGYLSMEKMCILSSDMRGDDEVARVRVEGSNCLENGGPADPAMLVQEADDEVHYYDFHIIYSDSYRIPVLYFRGYSCDGQLLIMDQFERDLPVRSAKILTESKWTFITQQEHPYLNRPWFTLHPCGTNELMKLLLGDISLSNCDVSVERYLLSWLTVVSQVVGLRVPLQMAST